MSVPTNLIPTKVTGLPEYTGTGTYGFMPYIIDGRTYKVQFSNIAAVGAVPSSRTIATGTGLTGGGDLSVDRVLSIAAGGVGFDQLALSGVAQGTYGSGSAIPILTVDAKGRVTSATTAPLDVTGFVPNTRTILAGDGLVGGGALVSNLTFSANFSAATPAALGAASAGTAITLSRGDHVHPAVNLSEATQTQGALPLGRGGTGDALSPVAGAVVYSTGTKFALSNAGIAGQVLMSNGTDEPQWTTISGVGTVTSVNLTAGTGISVSGGPITTAGSITVVNTAPDQIVSLTGAGGTSITGTYPSFTISSTSATGTVTSVAASGGTTGLTFTGSPITTAGTLTLGGTLAVANGGTGATDAASALTNLGAYPASNPAGYTSNVGTVTSVSGTGTVSGLSLSGTVTSTGSLTLSGTLAVLPSNFASQAANTVLAAPNGAAGVPTFRAIVAADIPTLNQNTTGTASNVTGIVAVANGGTGASVAGTARTNLGATTVGSNFFTVTNPSAITFARVNADNTVSLLDAATFRTAIGAGTGGGSVTSVAALTLGTTGTDLSSTVANGSTTPVITLNVPTASAANRGALSNTDWSTFNGKQAALVSGTNIKTVGGATLLGSGDVGTIGLAYGGTGATTAPLARTALGATTVGGNLFTLVDPSAITFPRFNADNTVSALNATDFRTAIGAGTSSTTGTVTSVAALTLGTTGTDLSSSVANGSTTPVITLNVPTASGTVRGALSSTDWSTFNGKQAALVSGTNIKTVGGATLLGSGDVGTIGVAYGGTGATGAAGARTNLGATTVGSNLFTLANPSAITFPRLNADNTVSALDAATFRTAIGAGTSSTTGTVTSVAMSVPAFLSISGSPITASGTLAVTLSGTALPVANGGTGATTLSSGYVLKGNGTSAVSASVIYDDGTNVSIGTTVARGNLSIGTIAGTATTLSVHLGYTPADYYGFRVANVSNASAVYAGSFSIQRGTGSAWSDALSISNAGNTTANVDMRAPVFYDSDNTAYFLDPNTTGNALRTAGYWLADTTAWAGDINGKIQYHDNSWYFSAANRWIFRASGGGEPFTVTQAGIVEAATDMRAPIFYDSNNTAYLFDGTSTSRWTTSNQDGYHTFNNYGLGVVGTYASTRFQCVFAMDNAYKGNADGTSLSGAYGLWWSYPSAGGPAATLSTHGLMCIVNGSNYAQLDASTRAITDMRTPIFYDLNDTAYFLDPNADLSLRVYGEICNSNYAAGALQSGAVNIGRTDLNYGWAGTTWASDIRLGLLANCSETWEFGIHDSGDSVMSALHFDGGTQFIIGRDIGWGTCYLTNPQSMRSPIFYDSDNTGFYFDGAATTNINTLSGNGKTMFETFDSYLRINQGSAFSNGCWFGGTLLQAGGYYAGSNGGTTTSRVAIIGGTYNGANVITLDGSTGDITAAGNVTAYSDIRIKANIETIPSALDKLDQIRGVTYTRTDLDDKERRYAGVIAQEIEAVLPEAVRDLGNIKAVDYNATIALLIQAVKELRDEVEALRK